MGFAYCRVLWYPQYAGVVAARCGCSCVGRYLCRARGPCCAARAGLVLASWHRTSDACAIIELLGCMCRGTSVLPDDGHYEAYTPLARVRTIAHPRRGAQQERAASPPRSSSLCNSGHFFEFRRFFYVFGHFHALLTQIGVKRGIF